MRTLLLFWFLSLLGFVKSPELYGQHEIDYDSLSSPVPLDFNEEKIASYKEDASFDYSERISQETWWTQFKRYLHLKWNSLMDWLFGSYQAEGILLVFLEILPYLIIAGIMILMLWLFNRLNPAAAYLEKSEEAATFMSEDEEIIQSRDIGKLIDTALHEKNYSLAIRYQYLSVLQALARKEIISYNPSKTNEEYSREIGESSIRELYKHLSWIYDYTWYGNFLADEKAYLHAERDFKELHKLISEGNEQE